VEGSGPRPRARLVLADDHGLVRQGMMAMLANEPDLEVIGEAENGREALELCRHHHPDLVLMDVRMPEMDGLTATRALKEECPETSVLMVTSHEDPEYLFEAIRVGAAGYVLKEATKHELLAAVRRVLEGESSLDQELATSLLQRLAGQTDPAAGRSPAPSQGAEEKRQGSLPELPTEQLASREVEVLRLVAEGLTNRQIAQAMLVSRSTVKTYVQRIIHKLGVSDRTQAAVRAVELGLLSNQEQE
jgi:NarL family two-component system response regulator LiaR